MICMGIDQLHINDWDKEKQIFSFTLQAATCAFGLAAQVGCQTKASVFDDQEGTFCCFNVSLGQP